MPYRKHIATLRRLDSLSMLSTCATNSRSYIKSMLRYQQLGAVEVLR